MKLVDPSEIDLRAISPLRHIIQIEFTTKFQNY